ncbi:hypothetical protein IP88_06770 [alpha proteobacterium AAP81b]|nr:hypothetical protein IP88_06770 [alpha proteobacterium AAP81b]
MVPYARLLDLSFDQSQGEARLLMPFAERLVGAPGRLHGGAIAGLLEIAGVAAVVRAMPEDEKLPRLRPVTVTVDYLRAGQTIDTYAAAEVTRLGRRVINVVSRAWQADRARPIASAHLNFLVDWPEG